MRCTHLRTKWGQDLEIGGLTVLVGPNNAGKSQTLKDVHGFLTSEITKRILIDTVDVDGLNSLNDYLSGVDVQDSLHNAGHSVFTSISSDLRSPHSFEYPMDSLNQQWAVRNTEFLRKHLGKFHVSFLDAGSRLVVAESGPSYDVNEAPAGTLLQSLYLRKEVQNELNIAFKKAFEMEVLLDFSALQTLSLRVASDFGSIATDPRDANAQLRRFPKLDVQGDGFRSFVGVVLSLLLTPDRLALLDEPEAFLHPEQARRLGQWIAERVDASDIQVIVATHNAHFLHGLLSAAGSAQVIRVNRGAEETNFHILDSEVTNKLARNPLLSSQRVIEAVFHRRAVVCESDTDRAVYQAVASRELGETDTLFVNAQNKQTCSTIAETLRAAGVPVAVAVDFDVLNAEKDVLALLDAFSVPDAEREKMRQLRIAVADSIEGRPESEVLHEIVASIDELQAQLHGDEHDLAGVRSALMRIRSSGNKWDAVKKDGVSALPSPADDQAQEIIRILGDFEIYVVPVGELEGWLDLGTRQKKRWVILALDAIAEGACTDELRDFVARLIGSVVAASVDDTPPAGEPLT